MKPKRSLSSSDSFDESWPQPFENSQRLWSFERTVTIDLDDRNTLFTTPHILCTLAAHEILPVEYVDAALSYYVETKGWDAQYVAQLRQHHLER